MSNILYIGPYRQYNYPGILSDIYLRSIGKALSRRNKRLYSRPLYMDPSVSLESQGIYEFEHIPPAVTSIEGIIQHCTPEYFAINKYAKNICIPILDPKLQKASAYNCVQKLNHADSVLVGTEQQKMFLLRSNITSPIVVCDEDLTDSVTDKQSQQAYDFGPIFNSCYNFGFIGQYDTNIQIIQKIILSFISAFRGLNRYRLVLFLRGTQQNRKELSNWYEKLLLDLHIDSSTNNNISFVFNTLEFEQTIAALNSIECLLSLNDDWYLSFYESYILKQNKAIINRYNTETISISPLKLGNDYHPDDILCSVSSYDLAQKMFSIEQKPHNHKKNTLSKIGDVVCQILK